MANQNKRHRESRLWGGSISRLGRGRWAIGAWAVAAIAVVALILPRARETTTPVDPMKEPLSTLVERGYLIMGQRDVDPTALDRALALFERGHELDPDHLDARFGLAWASQVKGRPEAEWRELYQETVTEASLLAYLALYNLGFAETQAGRYPEAIVFLEQAVRMMPDRADGWLEIGKAYEKMEDHERAVIALQRAIDLNPASAQALFLLGLTRSHLGQESEAEAAWARVLQLDQKWKERIEKARAE